MFKNYLKTAVRNLLRYKLYAGINISGLAAGIACCILILLFVQNELTYDRFHANADQIYRLYKIEERTNGERIQADLAPPLAEILAQEFPDLKNVVRIFKPFNEPAKLIHYGDRWFEEEIYFADPDFFVMFTFPLSKGNPATALQDLNAVVLSEQFAASYFGDDDPMGKRLSIRLGGKDQDFVVSGIAQNPPENSSIKFNLLLNYQKVQDELENFYGEQALASWNDFTEIYLRLPDEIKAAAVEAQFPFLIDKHLAALIQRWKNSGRLAKLDNALQLRLQPLSDIHFDPAVEARITPTSHPVYSYILAGIALLLLLLACINFTTLAMGRSVSRATEVGMRKVLGAVRGQLMKQFWGEALLMSLLALLLGIALAEILLPTFNELAGKTLALNFFTNWRTLAALLALMFFTALISGSYPAIFLSKFHPVEVLKGKLRLAGRRGFMRALIIFQFVLSIVLIISTLVMLRQLDYVRTKNLGFNREQVVVIPTHTEGSDGARLLEICKNTFLQNQSIRSVSGSDGSFAKPSLSMDMDAAGKSFSVPVYRVDYDYLETMGIELIAGRNFSRSMPSDLESAVIINETLAQALEWEVAVGKDVPIGFPTTAVIGVVKDYHFEALHHKIAPMLLHIYPDRPVKYIFVRLSPDRISETLAFLKEQWQEMAPSSPFTFSFLDEDVDRHYRAEERWEQIISHAAGLAIFISCLGLFGLTALTVTQRTKEIGIRKVMGATVMGIVHLLSKEFMKLVLVANLLAAPIAWYAMNRWLQNFAYRLDLGWWVFALAGGLAVVIALLTVSAQAIKAALANPVEALRYE